MKFKTLALFGVASAADELNFMQGDDSFDNTELLTIGSGACVNWSFTKNKFYDLKEFDTEFRDEGKKLPANLKFGADNFLYKAC